MTPPARDCAHDRTLMAWQRTTLATAVVALSLLKWSEPASMGPAMAGCGLVLAVTLGGGVASQRRRLHREGVVLLYVHRGIRTTLLAGAMILLCASEIAVLTHGEL